MRWEIKGFLFHVFFFNPKLKQTKIWQVELNRLNDRKKKGVYICASTTKVSRGMKKKKKKKNQQPRGILSQTLNKHLYLEICGCYMMANVDVIIQSEADQSDKIQNYFPWSKVSWEASCGLNTTLKGNQPSHLVWMSRQLAGGMSDSAPEEEKLWSTCCFLSVFQKGWRGSALALHCIRPALGLLTVELVQPRVTLGE